MLTITLHLWMLPAAVTLGFWVWVFIPSGRYTDGAIRMIIAMVVTAIEALLCLAYWLGKAGS